MRCSTVTNCIDDLRNCDGDGYNFHMTKKQDHFDQPYDTGKDNTYAISTHQTNLIQCRVTTKRDGDDVSATVYVGEKDNRGTEKGTIKNDGDHFIVGGLDRELTISKGTDDATNPLTYSYEDQQVFAWSADKKGTSNQFASDGSYCKISDGGKSTDCYFPCEAGPDD